MAMVPVCVCCTYRCLMMLKCCHLLFSPSAVDATCSHSFLLSPKLICTDPELHFCNIYNDKLNAKPAKKILIGSAFVCSTWKDHYNCHPTKVCSIFLTVNYLSNCLSQHSWECLKIQEGKDKVGVGIILHCSSVWFTLRFSRCCKGSKFILRSVFWWDAQKKWNTARAGLLICKWGNSTSTCFFFSLQLRGLY